MEGSQGRVDAKDVPSGSKFTLESAFHPDAREKSYCHPGGLQPMTKLELFYAQKSKKFDQLCILAARELGYGELSICVEVKDGAKPPSRRRLTKVERRIHDWWTGGKRVVENI